MGSNPAEFKSGITTLEPTVVIQFMVWRCHPTMVMSGSSKSVRKRPSLASTVWRWEVRHQKVLNQKEAWIYFFGKWATSLHIWFQQEIMIQNYENKNYNPVQVGLVFKFCNLIGLLNPNLGSSLSYFGREWSAKPVIVEAPISGKSEQPRVKFHWCPQHGNPPVPPQGRFSSGVSFLSRWSLVAGWRTGTLLFGGWDQWHDCRWVWLLKVGWMEKTTYFFKAGHWCFMLH